MTRKISLLLAFFMCLALTEVYSQDDKLKITAKPKDMWEVGINLGHSILVGDVDWNSDFGAGLHVRKSLDYTFSVRLDASYNRLSGEEDQNTREVDASFYADEPAGSGAFRDTWKPIYESSLISGDLSLIASLNQLKVFKKNKINPYIFGGVGITSITANAIDGGAEVDIVTARNFDESVDISPTANGGFGIGFLLGKKISLSIEHKVTKLFGRAADLLDGVEFQGTLSDRVITKSDDLVNYTNLRLGIPLGKTEDKSVPLWWASPLDLLAEDLAEVKQRPIFNDADTDGDGVLDDVDKEPDTREGCPVDTRGVTLDSDGDGIADCDDEERFSPPGYEVNSKGVADVPQPVILSEEDVNKLIDARLPPPVDKTDWFLPMVFFGSDSYSIRTSEYAKLHNVATVMRLNPNVSVVATGHTDRRAGECYNDVLSFNRAQAAIDYLVTKYGIDRGRFILNWGGEKSTLVDTNSGSMMNRRVEFTVATTEANMGRPDCGVNNAGSGSGTKYSGNKEAGY